MNLDNVSIACSEVDQLLNNLTKKNLKQTNQELNTLIDYHGTDLQQYLLRRLFEFTSDTSNTQNISTKSRTAQDTNTNSPFEHYRGLLASRIPSLLQRQDFITLISQTYPDTTEKDNSDENENLFSIHKYNLRKPIQHLDYLSKSLQLSTFQKILFGIAFSYHKDFTKAPNWVLQRLSEFIDSSNRNTKNKSSNTSIADEFSGETGNCLKTADGYGFDGSLVPIFHVIVDFLHGTKQQCSARRANKKLERAVFSSSYSQTYQLSKADPTHQFIELLKNTFPLNKAPAELIPLLYSHDPEYNQATPVLKPVSLISKSNNFEDILKLDTGKSERDSTKNSRKNSKVTKETNKLEEESAPKRLRTTSACNKTLTALFSNNYEPMSSVGDLISEKIDRLIEEEGYAFTATKEECESRLLDLWQSNTSESLTPSFTPLMVAKVLIMMSNTHVNLHKSSLLNGTDQLFQSEINSWNVKNFLDVVYKFNVTLTMHSIVAAMDQPSFLIEEEPQLQFIVESVEIMCEWNLMNKNAFSLNSKMPFPLDLFFSKSWVNKRNQAVFVETAVIKSQTICIAESHPEEKRTKINILEKNQNHESYKPLVLFWQCPAFVECLIGLYDYTPTNNTETNLPGRALSEEARARIHNLFTESANLLPDVVILALLNAHYNSGTFYKHRAGIGQKLSTPEINNASIGIEILMIEIQKLLERSEQHPNTLALLQFAWDENASPARSKHGLEDCRTLLLYVFVNFHGSERDDDDRRVRTLKLLNWSFDLKIQNQVLPTVLSKVSRHGENANRPWLEDANARRFLFSIDFAVHFSRREHTAKRGNDSRFDDFSLNSWLIQSMDGFKKSFMSACIEYLDFICGYYHLKQNIPSLTETKNAENTEITLDECHITFSEFEQILSVIRNYLSVYGTENDRNSWAKVDQAINEYSIPLVLQKQQEQLDINEPAGMLTENVANFFSSVGIPGGKQASKTSTLPGLVFLANKSPLSSEKMVQLINTFSPDLTEVNDETIQEETNRYFLFMFRKEWKIKQVIDDLRQKKKSEEARSNQVFNCMLKSLLDEHTYFHRYPELNLLLTAELFGGLVRENLLFTTNNQDGKTDGQLQIALTVILDSIIRVEEQFAEDNNNGQLSEDELNVKKEEQYKYFRFGITALNEFRSSLKNYQEFCQHLCKLRLFQDDNFELAQKILKIPLENKSVPATSVLVDFEILLDYVRQGQFERLPQNHDDYEIKDTVEDEEEMKMGDQNKNLNDQNGLNAPLPVESSVQNSETEHQNQNQGKNQNNNHNQNQNEDQIQNQISDTIENEIMEDAKIQEQNQFLDQLQQNIHNSTDNNNSDNPSQQVSQNPAEMETTENNEEELMRRIDSKDIAESMELKESIDQELNSQNMEEADSRPETLVKAAENLKKAQLSVEEDYEDELSASARNKIVVPPEDFIAKVTFSLNQLTPNSIEGVKEKFVEMFCVGDNVKYAPWLCRENFSKCYTIPNQMKVIVDLANGLDKEYGSDMDSDISDWMIAGTIDEIKNILMTFNGDAENPKQMNTLSRHKDLRNLGRFLGQITLNENKPILHEDLDIKSLLHEAYTKGKEATDCVVPFVCELFKHVRKSTIFNRPNAWTEGILQVLDEIMEKTNNQKGYMNINYAIEILFHELGIEKHEYRTSLKEKFGTRKFLVEPRHAPDQMAHVKRRKKPLGITIKSSSDHNGPPKYRISELKGIWEQWKHGTPDMKKIIYEAPLNKFLKKAGQNLDKVFVSTYLNSTTRGAGNQCWFTIALADLFFKYVKQLRDPKTPVGACFEHEMKTVATAASNLVAKDFQFYLKQAQVQNGRNKDTIDYIRRYSLQTMKQFSSGQVLVNIYPRFEKELRENFIAKVFEQFRMDTVYELPKVDKEEEEKPPTTPVNPADANKDNTINVVHLENADAIPEHIVAGVNSLYTGSVKALRRLCDDLVGENQPLFSALLQHNIITDDQSQQKFFTESFQEAQNQEIKDEQWPENLTETIRYLQVMQDGESQLILKSLNNYPGLINDGDTFNAKSPPAGGNQTPATSSAPNSLPGSNQPGSTVLRSHSARPNEISTTPTPGGMNGLPAGVRTNLNGMVTPEPSHNSVILGSTMDGSRLTDSRLSQGGPAVQQIHLGQTGTSVLAGGQNLSQNPGLPAISGLQQNNPPFAVLVRAHGSKFRT